jgi:CBS domain-containing protein
MLVADVMRTDMVTIRPDATVQEAIELARTRGIRHLPVLEDGALVGIVSDRDLKRTLVPEAAVRRLPGVGDLPARLTVADIMSRPVITIAMAFAVEDAARVMVAERISALPVTDGARLVGMVTETDLLALLVRALGAVEPSGGGARGPTPSTGRGHRGRRGSGSDRLERDDAPGSGRGPRSGRPHRYDRSPPGGRRRRGPGLRGPEPPAAYLRPVPATGRWYRLQMRVR